MEIKISVEGLDAIDLQTVVGEEAQYDPLFPEDDSVLGAVTLADVVAQKLAEQLMKDDMYPRLKERIRSIREEEVRKALVPIIQDVVKTPIKPTNGYGEVVGRETTLSQMIAEEARKILNQPRSGSNGYGSRDLPLVQQLVRDEITRVLGSELRGVIDEEKAKIKKIVAARGAQLMTESLATLVIKD